VSFEIDLDPMKLALKNPSAFTYLRHGAPHAVMSDRQWISGQHRIKWTLHEGDFLEEFKNKALPDLIFYDPFSLHTDSKLWTLDTFQKLIHHWSTKPMKFMTYSASNLVRAMLLSEGLYVGYGVGTGPKATTTVAFNNEAMAMDHGKLLAADWLTTWKRSGSQFPVHFSSDEKAEFESRILNHPQFKSLLHCGTRQN
jgi:queuine tRNA-ribosyltransferase